LKPIELRDAGEIECTVAAFAREPNGDLIVPISGLAISHRDLIVTLAGRHRLPAPTDPSSPWVARFPKLGQSPSLVDQLGTFNPMLTGPSAF
jgi:hypothetical protein